jgi:hypothetical protein
VVDWVGGGLLLCFVSLVGEKIRERERAVAHRGGSPEAELLIQSGPLWDAEADEYQSAISSRPTHTQRLERLYPLLNSHPRSAT